MPAISGTVYDNAGAPVAGRVVRAYRRDTGALFGGVTSSDFIPATAEDPHYSDVSLLLHMDGVEGSTAFPDASPAPKTVTVFGDTKLSLAQTKFGGVSAFFDGSGDYLTVPYTSGGFRWFGASYTLEAWVYPVTLSSMSYLSSGQITPKLISNSAIGSSVNYWCFGPHTDGRVAFRYWNGSAPITVVSTETVSEGAWSHIELDVDAGQIKIFVNGVKSGEAAISGSPQDDVALPLLIGATNAKYMHAYVAGLRITKGVARHSASFTPPIAPFSGAAGTAEVPVGSYRIPTSYTGEAVVVCLDDAAGTTFNDLVLRTSAV